MQEYLYKQGGIEKLRSRTQEGKAQFMGVDDGAAASEASAAKRGAESDRRYKMHIIKFRLVNGSDPAATVPKKVEAKSLHKSDFAKGKRALLIGLVGTLGAQKEDDVHVACSLSCRVHKERLSRPALCFSFKGSMKCICNLPLMNGRAQSSHSCEDTYRHHSKEMRFWSSTELGTSTTFSSCPLCSLLRRCYSNEGQSGSLRTC